MSSQETSKSDLVPILAEPTKRLDQVSAGVKVLHGNLRNEPERLRNANERTSLGGSIVESTCPIKN